MKNPSFSRRFGGLKYKLFDTFKENKKTTLFLIIFCLIGLLTGIFTAIRYSNGASLINFNDFSLSQYLSNKIFKRRLAHQFQRFFSLSISFRRTWNKRPFLFKAAFNKCCRSYYVSLFVFDLSNSS